MNIVLDTSAAFEIVLFRPEREKIWEELSKANIVLAPDLFYSEAANVVWKMYRFEKKKLSDYELALHSVINLIDEFHSSESLWEKAFQLACETELTVYDCIYLQLARESKAKLFSMDKKLNRKALEIGITVLF